MASAAGCIKAQWKGAETGSSIARRAPFVAGDVHRPLDGLLGAGNHHLAAAIVVGGLADGAGGAQIMHGHRRDRCGFAEVEAEDRRHGAGADRAPPPASPGRAGAAAAPHRRS